MSQMILQYLLGFCAWYGLSTIGEPPLEDHSTSLSRIQAGRKRHVESPKDPMPVWLILLFFALVAARYILSFLVSAWFTIRSLYLNLMNARYPMYFK